MTAVELAAYLEAKALLDQRSLNLQVFELFCEVLGGFPEAAIVDLGTGTGAMLRRLALTALNPALILTGVEREAALVGAALGCCQQVLASAGWKLNPTGDGFEAKQGECWRRFHFVCADCFEFAPAGPCHAVCAHTFMDLVPLAKTLDLISGWLTPGGVFYASCNYDGGTTLFPVSSDPVFEAELLARYHRSMESRRLDGEMTGGALCGRRLYQALVAGGWEILSFGSSDWNLTPVRRSYRGADALVLEALLAMIRSEGGGLEQRALEDWHKERLEQLKTGRLGLIIHQLDLLAARP